MQRLEFYSEDELARIVRRSAGILGVDIAPEGATEIAGVHAALNVSPTGVAARACDYAQVKSHGVVDAAVADSALQMLKVDVNGFDQMDRRLLQAVIEKFDGGPVGVDNLAAAIGESAARSKTCSNPI